MSSSTVLTTKPLGSLIAERELLIRYIIYSANVEIRLSLPAGAKALEDLDLTCVDVTSLVACLCTGTLNNAAVDVDFTDCPLKRFTGESMPAPFSEAVIDSRPSAHHAQLNKGLRDNKGYESHSTSYCVNANASSQGYTEISGHTSSSRYQTSAAANSVPSSPIPGFGHSRLGGAPHAMQSRPASAAVHSTRNSLGAEVSAAYNNKVPPSLSSSFFANPPPALASNATNVNEVGGYPTAHSLYSNAGTDKGKSSSGEGSTHAAMRIGVGGISKLLPDGKAGEKEMPYLQNNCSINGGERGRPVAVMNDVFASAWVGMVTQNAGLRVPTFVGNSYGSHAMRKRVYSKRPFVDEAVLPMRPQGNHSRTVSGMGSNVWGSPLNSTTVSRRTDFVHASDVAGTQHGSPMRPKGERATDTNFSDVCASASMITGWGRLSSAAFSNTNTVAPEGVEGHQRVSHADDALMLRDAGGAVVSGLEGASSAGYDAGDTEAALLLGGAHVQFIPSCVATDLFPSDGRVVDEDATPVSATLLGHNQLSSADDLCAPQLRCPRPMEFDNTATVSGDLFDPFETSGQPFSLWLYDMALVSSGMLMGVEEVEAEEVDDEVENMTPSSKGGDVYQQGYGEDKKDGGRVMLRAHMAGSDMGLLTAVLTLLRNALGVTDEEHAASYSTFFPSQEDIVTAVLSGTALMDSEEITVPPTTILHGSFASPAEFAGLRNALPLATRAAVASRVSAAPSYMTACLNRSDNVGVRARHELLGNTKASAFGEEKGQFPAAVKALAVAGVMSLGVRITDSRPAMQPFSVFGDGSSAELLSMGTEATGVCCDNNNMSNTTRGYESTTTSATCVSTCSANSESISSLRSASLLDLIVTKIVRSLAVPASVLGLCRAHALMIAQRRFNDEASSGVDSVVIQGAFLNLIATAMEDDWRMRGGSDSDDSSVRSLLLMADVTRESLARGERAPLKAIMEVDPNYHRYRNYVVESLLQLAVVPLLVPSTLGLGEGQGGTMRAAVRVLAAACVSCCEAKIVGSVIDVREMKSGGTHATEVFQYCLSELVSIGVYNGGYAPASDETLSIHKSLTGLSSAHASAVAFMASTLGPLVPCVPTLLLRASYRLIGFSLRRRWDASASHGVLPDNFTTGMQALREATETIFASTKDALERLSQNNNANESDAPLRRDSTLLSMLTSVLRQSVGECFDWLVPLFELRNERVAMEMQSREAELFGRLAVVDNGVAVPSKTVVHNLSEVFLLYRQLFDPLPSAVVSNPNDLFMQFTSCVLNQINSVAMRITHPFCVSQRQNEFVKCLPHALRSADSAGFLKTWKLAVVQMEKLYPSMLDEKKAPVEGLVQRLNTLKGLFIETQRFLSDVTSAHGRVRSLTGCSELAALKLFDEQVASEQSPLLCCIRDISDCLGIQHVKGLYTLHTNPSDGRPCAPREGGFAHLYLTDMKRYKTLKSATGTLVLDPLYKKEECSMSAIVDAFDAAIPNTLSLVDDFNCRNRVVSSCHRYFLAAIAELLLNGGEGRYFDTSHVSSLLEDLDEVIEYFDTTAPKDSIVTDTAAYNLGHMLRRTVADLFSKETSTLIKGNPSYEECDEISVGTPMCRMVIRHILAHRKDKEAKKFCEKHPLFPKEA